MTEAEWLACDDPMPMLEFLRGKVTERSARLFACACCRRIMQYLPEKRFEQAIETTELFADGQVGQAEMNQAYRACVGAGDEWEHATKNAKDRHVVGSAIPAVELLATGGLDPSCTDVNAIDAAIGISRWVARTVWISQLAVTPVSQHIDDVNPEAVPYRRAELREQAGLLRHFVNNPFARMSLPALPNSVVSLAEQLYRGSQVSSSLAAALTTNGASQLASHFSSSFHPKGCWAVDLVLGKE
jgi:hypothetical protein